MAFKFNGHNSFFKDFYNSPQDIQTVVKSHGINITQNPYNGVPYPGGGVDELWKFEFKIQKISYRIVYAIYHCKKKRPDGTFFCINSITHHGNQLQDCDGLIDFVFFKTRQAMDNIYKLRKKKLKSYMRFIG